MMKEAIKQFIRDSGADAVGFASVDRFDGADEAHHPAAVCARAKAVVVIGKTMPRGVLRSPRYSLHSMHRSYHTLYPYLDDVALRLSCLIEERGHYAVPVPSYAPLVYRGAEPWGILSLKHAAVRAGLGSFGRTGLVYNSRFGSLLRFSAVVTDAEIEPDAVSDTNPCPDGCRACAKACPSGAIGESGFDKMKCMLHTIRHGIYPLALKDETGIKNIEIILNTAGYNYWLKCNECLKVCPLNR
jgi:epoxyqueuosine reductase